MPTLSEAIAALEKRLNPGSYHEYFDADDMRAVLELIDTEIASASAATEFTDGTAAAPGVKFVDPSGSGMFRELEGDGLSADKVALSVNGREVVAARSDDTTNATVSLAQDPNTAVSGTLHEAFRAVAVASQENRIEAFGSASDDPVTLKAHKADSNDDAEIDFRVRPGLDLSTDPGVGLNGRVLISGDQTRGVDITSYPYSMPRDGASGDLSAKITEAIGDGYNKITIPPGAFRMTTALSVPAGVEIEAAGTGVTTIDASAVTGTYPITIAANTDNTGGLLTDWAKVRLADFTLVMAKGGIDSVGRDVILDNIEFRGGSALGGGTDASNYWAVRMRATHGCVLNNLRGGFTNVAYDLDTDGGILIYAADNASPIGNTATNENVTNFGSSTIINCEFRGQATTFKGLCMRHDTTDASAGAITGMRVIGGRFHTENAVSGNLTNTRGIFLHRVQESSFYGIDVVESGIGVYLSGTAAVPSSRNTFTLVDSFGALTQVSGTNGTTSGSVIDNVWIGCGGPADVLPAGIDASTSGEEDEFGQGPYTAAAKAIKSGNADSHFASVWVHSGANGKGGVQLRAPAEDKLLITAEGRATDSLRSDNVLNDGHPKNTRPQKGVEVDVSNTSTAKISRPIGITTRSEARLEIGNGSAHSDGPLKNVRILDPIHMPGLDSVPTYAPEVGSIAYFDNRSAFLDTFASWVGPGWYRYTDDTTDGGSTNYQWLPHGQRGGLVRGRKVTASFTLTRRDMGGYVIAESTADPLTGIIPSDLLRDEEAGSTFISGTAENRAVAEFYVIRSGDGPVSLTAGSGVTIISPDNQTAIPIKGGVARVVLVRTGSQTCEAHLSFSGKDESGELTTVQWGNISGTLADQDDLQLALDDQTHVLADITDAGTIAALDLPGLDGKDYFIRNNALVERSDVTGDIRLNKVYANTNYELNPDGTGVAVVFDGGSNLDTSGGDITVHSTTELEAESAGLYRAVTKCKVVATDNTQANAGPVLGFSVNGTFQNVVGQMLFLESGGSQNDGGTYSDVFQLNANDKVQLMFRNDTDTGSAPDPNNNIRVMAGSEFWLERMEVGYTGGAASVAWGAITGTLADQADLNAALAGKSDTSHTHTLSDITDSGEFAALDYSGLGAGKYGVKADGTFEAIVDASLENTYGWYDIGLTDNPYTAGVYTLSNSDINKKLIIAVSGTVDYPGYATVTDITLSGNSTTGFNGDGGLIRIEIAPGRELTLTNSGASPEIYVDGVNVGASYTFDVDNTRKQYFTLEIRADQIQVV